MPYLDITDFRSGLDSRKYKLALPAGTLTDLVNGHITAGGEIEKRKAFLPFNRPTGTFGAEPSDLGIVVFGSREGAWAINFIAVTDNVVVATITPGISGVFPATGDTITVSGTVNYNGTFVLTLGGSILTWNQTNGSDPESSGVATQQFTSPIIFQQLLHPDGATQMTGVIYSTSFGGNQFVIAEFSDGNSFFYFGGTLINDFQAGLIWSGSTSPFSLLTNLASIINATTPVDGLPQKNYPYVATVTPIPASLNFSISGGTAAVAAVAAASVFNLTPNPSTGNVILGGVTYTLTTGSVGAGTATSIKVKIGGSLAATLTNLYHAINYSGGNVGNDYSTGGAANGSAAATALNTSGSGTYPDGFLVTATTPGAAGNSIVCTTTISGASWTPSATLGGGLDAVAAQGQVLEVWYNFPTVVQLTAYLGTNSAMIVQSPIAFSTSATDLATAVALAITNATDSYLGGPGDNLGFTATSIGYEVLITPPQAITPYDSLSVYTDSFLTATTQPIANQITITSVPTTSSASPFALSVALKSDGGSETDGLLNVGSPIVPPTYASGSFRVSACNISTQATATLLAAGSNVGANDAVTIGGSVYTFVTALKGAAVNSVLLGSNIQGSLANLSACIAGLTASGGGSGKTWAAGTAPNQDMTASTVQTGTGTLLGLYYLNFTAILGGLIGNAIALSTTSAVLNWQTVPSVPPANATLHPAGGLDSNSVTQITVGTTAILSNEIPSSGGNPTTMANDICTGINNNTAASGYSASCVGGTVTISSTTGGVANNALAISVVCAGAVCIDQAEFIVSGTGGITSIAVAGGPGNLLSVTTLAFQQSGHSGETLVQFCARVVANINAYTGTTGYVAAADPSSPVIYISRATATSDDAASINLTITSSLTCNPTTVAMQASVSPAIAQLNSHPPKSSGKITASVVGGTSPYSYQWTFVSSSLGVSSGVGPATPAKSSTTFNLNILGMFAGKSFIEQWVCQVTDSSATPIVVNSSVLMISVVY